MSSPHGSQIILVLLSIKHLSKLPTGSPTPCGVLGSGETRILSQLGARRACSLNEAEMTDIWVTVNLWLGLEDAWCSRPADRCPLQIYVNRNGHISVHVQLQALQGSRAPVTRTWWRQWFTQWMASDIIGMLFFLWHHVQRTFVTIVMEAFLALFGSIGGILCFVVSVLFCRVTCCANYAQAGAAGVSYRLHCFTFCCMYHTSYCQLANIS